MNYEQKPLIIMTPLKQRENITVVHNQLCLLRDRSGFFSYICQENSDKEDKKKKNNKNKNKQVGSQIRICKL